MSPSEYQVCQISSEHVDGKVARWQVLLAPGKVMVKVAKAFQILRWRV